MSYLKPLVYDVDPKLRTSTIKTDQKKENYHLVTTAAIIIASKDYPQMLKLVDKKQGMCIDSKQPPNKILRTDKGKNIYTRVEKPGRHHPKQVIKVNITSNEMD